MAANPPAVLIRAVRVTCSPEIRRSLFTFSFQLNATIANGTLEKAAVY